LANRSEVKLWLKIKIYPADLSIDYPDRPLDKLTTLFRLFTSIFFDIDILKIAHHGSRSSLFPMFLSVVQPEVAIYMAGEDNTYGHPHPETISALEDIGAEIYSTDVCGTIIVAPNGTGYTVSGCTP